MTWVGFELSLLGFLPMFTGTSLVVEGMVKYFLSQAGGSSLFIVSFMLSGDFYSVVLLMLGMSMKIGVFPFYQWVPMVMSSLSWGGCLLLSTVQKLPPLIVMFGQRDDLGVFILVSGVFRVLLSGFLGYNQSYMRSLIAYSSISHIGWLLCAGVVSLRLVFVYLVVYYYLVVVLFFFFGRNYVLKVVGGSVSFKDLFFINLLVLAMAGIPPFAVFFLKAFIVYGLLEYGLVVVFMIFGAMLSIYSYLTFVIPRFSGFWLSQEVERKGFFKFGAFFVSLFFPFLFII